MARRVWVGGTVGQTPTVVATSLERAMMETVALHRVPQTIEESGYPEQWTGGFIDGEPGDLRFRTTLVDGDETVELYLEQFDLEEDTGEPLWAARQ